MMILDPQVRNVVMGKTCKKSGFIIVLFSIIIGIAFNNAGHAQQETAPDADVVIVGAGISGLSAALEAGRGGAKVAVIDMFSGPLESRTTRNWLTRISWNGARTRTPNGFAITSTIQ